jgi:hypothetical protein
MTSSQSSLSSGSWTRGVEAEANRRELTERYLAGELDYETYRAQLKTEPSPLRDLLLLGGFVGLALWLLSKNK